MTFKVFHRFQAVANANVVFFAAVDKILTDVARSWASCNMHAKHGCTAQRISRGCLRTAAATDVH